MKLIIPIIIACLSTPAFAEVYIGGQDVEQCLYQLKLVPQDEAGEATSSEDVTSAKDKADGVQTFKILQNDNETGYLQIDSQGDISSVTKDGELISNCG